MLLNFKELKEKYKLNINGVIHIGGHHGEEHNTYKINGIINIIYFEPLKHNFDVLKSRTNNESIYIMEALGSKMGELEMFVEYANQSQSSSLLEPKKHLEQYPWITFNHKIKVKVNLLDNFKLNNDFNFINMDVQGYELEVLKGSNNTLKQIDHIMTEINFEDLYENCVKFDELDLFLNQFGFKRLFTAPTQYGWGDAFYSKVKI
jgi:FkbM family methyltransferase